MASKTTIHCCFRGEDTRNSFTGFLFQALSRKGTIDAFKDGKDLKKGESIAPELIQAIQGSRLFFIVVFSNNYAFSTIRKKGKSTLFLSSLYAYIYPVQYLMKVIDFRGFHPKYGLQVLIDRSLITIKYELIHMRDLLRDLGRYIVREKSPKKPRKWSRLWDFKKISTKAADYLEAMVIKNKQPLQSTQFETFDSLIPKIQLRCQILGRP
ncbi:hypothetical protein JHK82_034088 [Glycine max]|nr:hypothetical protein JHK87_034016 [Glycine soja]KAG4980839.1 hypothetical protein JHK85_034797 [Glycine max]KAG4986467.1 hypothetical protein JHK86_034158 [Glycine max]KAG5119668.1 hypothetical protein JHK82_034088 [Glycine max]KAG5140656.1 hypothetical protein JHK84_034424 [Glycine max]